MDLFQHDNAYECNLLAQSVDSAFLQRNLWMYLRFRLFDGTERFHAEGMGDSYPFINILSWTSESNPRVFVAIRRHERE